MVVQTEKLLGETGINVKSMKIPTDKIILIRICPYDILGHK
jgi:hypothetical protein